MWVLDYFQGEQAIAATPVREVTAASVAQRVRDARGRVLIFSLYRPHSDDAYVVVALRRWAVQMTSPSAEVLAFAVGARRDAQLLFRDGEERGVQRLPPEWLDQRQLEAFDSAMAQLGIPNSGHSTLPLTVVFDRSGRVTEHWRGTLDYVPVLAAAKAARQQ
jgi:hypothetical protein